MPPPDNPPTAIVDVPIQGGVREDFYRYALPMGQGFLQVDNGFFTAQGAIVKRNSYSPRLTSVYPTGTTLANPYQLETLDRELLCLGGSDVTVGTDVYTKSNLLSLREHSNTQLLEYWSFKGALPPALIKREALVRGPYDVLQTALVAWSPTQRLYAMTWTAAVSAPSGLTSGSYFRAWDPVTGVIVLPDTFLQASVAQPFVWGSQQSNYLFACQYDGTDPIKCWVYDSANNVIKTPTLTLVSTGVAALSAFDLWEQKNGNGVCYVVWGNGNKVELRKVTVNGTAMTVVVNASQTLTLAATQTVLAVTVCQGANSSNVIVYYLVKNTVSVNDEVYCETFNTSSLAVVGGPSLVASYTYTLGSKQLVTSGIDNAGNAWYVATDQDAASGPTLVRFGARDTNSNNVVATRTVRGVVCARPLLANTRMFALIEDGGTMFLAGIDNATTADGPVSVHGVLAREECGAFNFMGVSADVSLYPNSFVLALVSQSATRKWADLVRLSFGYPSPELWSLAGVKRNAVITGSLTAWYDGLAVTEVGFLARPNLAYVSQSAGPGSIAAGTYLYQAFWEYLDTRGNLHRSPVSLPVTVVVAGANTRVSLSVDNLPWTRRQNTNMAAGRDFRLVLCRTTAGGTQFYRQVSLTSGGGAGADVINNKSTPTLSFTDSMADATLTSLGYGFAYTDGGVLENSITPASVCAVTHKNRVWIASAEDRFAVYYSKQLQDGLAPGFSDAFVVRIDDSPDGVIALSSLDDKLIIWTSTRIYYVVGDGPSDTGGGDTFSTPQLIASDVGVLGHKAMCLYHEGIVFASPAYNQNNGGNYNAYENVAAGIFLLDRALRVTEIGRPVQATLATYSNVLDICNNPANNKVYCLCQNPNNNQTKWVVYDPYLKVWSTQSTAQSSVQQSQTVFRGLHYFTDSLGVNQECYGNEPGCDNNTSYVVTTVETPWITVGPIGSPKRFEKLFLTCRRVDTHDIHLEVAYDYDEASTPSKLDAFTDNTPADYPVLNIATTSVERLAWVLKPQKSQAIKIKIYDGKDSHQTSFFINTPVGYALFGLSLKVAQEPDVPSIYAQGKW